LLVWIRGALLVRALAQRTSLANLLACELVHQIRDPIVAHRRSLARQTTHIVGNGGTFIHRANRAAFTLAEVLVALTLIAVLSVVIVPTVSGRLQSAYENSIVAEFDNLASAIAAYRQDVGKYPPALDYLTALRTTPLDRCGVQLSAAAKANYRGPYVTREILNSVGYLLASKDTVNDAITTKSSPVGLGITILGPDTLTSHNIDVQIDGFANKTLGAVQWASNGTDQALTFIIPTASGAC
jgi:prepilin-type N-terminal cleavage/methylation domain-containing protein